MLSISSEKPLVSVCIPAFLAQEFIDCTIQSVLEQTVQDYEIIISDDGYLTPTLAAWNAHPKIRVFHQSKRLGWVENTNFALSQARGHYFMVLPHDDLLRPLYLEACLSVLEENPAVFAAYSDLESDKGLLIASEVRGPLDARITNVVKNLYNGYSYRAVMRCRPEDWPHLKLRENRPTNFCVDSTWILQQACLGELRKVPKALYWKRYFERNTHHEWVKIPKDDLSVAWMRHCSQLNEIANSYLDAPELVADLIRHRRDPRKVLEAPSYLKNVFSNNR